MKISSQDSMTIFRWGAIILSLNAAFCLGGSPAASAHRTVRHFVRREFAYAVGGDLIYQYAVGAKGALKPLTPPTVLVKLVRTEAARDILVLNPVRPFAYLQFGGHILQYRIQPNGQLSPLGVAPQPLNGLCEDLVVDPRGRFLYAVMANSLLPAYRIGSNGQLYPQPSTTVDEPFLIAPTDRPLPPGVHEEEGLITIDPSGRFLYSYSRSGFVDHSEGELARYRIGASGQLIQVGDVEGDSGEMERTGAVIFNPNGRYAYRNFQKYSAEKEKEEEAITVWRVVQMGALLPVRSKPVNTNRMIKSIDPTGHWALCNTDDDHRLYRIRQDGTLSPRSQLIWRGIAGVTIDPTGQFLYAPVFDQDGQHITLLIARTGSPGESQLKSWEEKLLLWSSLVIVRFLSPYRVAVSPGQSTGMQKHLSDASTED